MPDDLADGLGHRLGGGAEVGADVIARTGGAEACHADDDYAVVADVTFPGGSGRLLDCYACGERRRQEGLAVGPVLLGEQRLRGSVAPAMVEHLLSMGRADTACFSLWSFAGGRSAR